jgi:hypothetical protein
MTQVDGMLDHSGRNTVWGFRERVIKNLMFLKAANNTGSDVHVVTQLVTSLLGLIVFPYEEIRRSGYVSFKQVSLADLRSQGWPEWRFHTGSSSDLQDLVGHLRNAISHRRLVFSPDSRELCHVEIRFHDRKRSAGPIEWEASVNAQDLLDFVVRFADLLHQSERV